MGRNRERLRRPAGAIAVAGVVLASALLLSPARSDAAWQPDRPAAPKTGPGISQHDKDLLAKAERQGKRTVQVLVMTKPGATRQTTKQLARRGAQLRYRADELGYVRLEVPVGEVEQVARTSGVTALDVDEAIVPEAVTPSAVGNPIPQPAPGAGTPRANPYLPTGDTGAAQFVDAHPTWDGRNTRIAILDTGIDLGHPALQQTTTGERKIVDWVTGTDGGFTNGVNNDDDPTWVLMTGRLPGDYRPPDGGAAFRFGVFDERDPRLGGEIGNDVNRDGNPAGSSGTFGVLWDPATNRVWVDANQDKSFADDPAMTDYKVKYDVGTFGADNPNTPIREAMSFAVQTDPANQSVNIGVVSGGHATHVAGIAAGNGFFGGSMSGAAPGAQLISVRTSTLARLTQHALLEGMIYAARDAGADVVNLSSGTLLAVNDGRSARAELYNRVTDTYDVQLFISAGNEGSAANSVDDPGTADKVISVGAYIGRNTWLRDHGVEVANQDNLHLFTSRGPREDGGLKPDIVAPGTAVASWPSWQAGRPVAGTFGLPPGYATLNGTSMAAPQATGAAALLVSAAIAQNVGHRPAQLRKAIVSSARYLPGYQAYEQGSGLFTVDRAWELLERGGETVAVTSSVEVNTALSGYLAAPGVGVGIYDREGVRASASYVREYTFLRTSGVAGARTYKVVWLGNDGTFSSATTVVLPKGEPVAFPVVVKAPAGGIRSAILRLDDPSIAGVELQTLNTVIVAGELTAANNYTAQFDGEVGRAQAAHHFVRVGPNAKSLTVSLRGGGTSPGTGQLRFVRYNAYGIAAETTYPGNNWCYNPPPSNGVCQGGTAERRTLYRPEPGVWEINVEHRQTSDALTAPYTLTVSEAGVQVSPPQLTIPTATIGQPVTRQYTFTNSAGAFTGRATGTTLGSARFAKPTIAQSQLLDFPVTVPAGATQLRAKVDSPADVRNDFWIHLLNCTSGTGACTEAAFSWGEGRAREEAVVDNPAAGRWVVRVEGYQIAGGTTTFDYQDVIVSPSYGSITANDASALRAAGERWQAPVVVTANAAPGAGRQLFGQVEVKTDAGDTVGAGDVVINNLSP